MTKILKILTALTVVMSAPLTIVACNNNKINNGINLNSIIKNNNLVTIKTYGGKIPTIEEIIATVKKLNTNQNIDWSKITVDENSITNTGAQLISTDTKVYYDNVAIKYTIDASINLNSIIKNTNINLISINSENKKEKFTTLLKKETLNKIKLLNQNKDIDWNKITVDENSITNTGAQLISTDTKVYYDNVAIKYTIDASINLNSIIKNTNINLISINSENKKEKFTTLLKKETLNKIKLLNQNKDIDWNKITVDENSITNTGAQLISTDTKVYYGVVNIIFTVNITNNNLNYNDNKSFNGTDSNEKGISSEIVLFKNWNYYSNNWQNFVQAFPKIIFANDSYLEVSSQYYKSKLSASQLNINTKQISDKFKDIIIGWNPDDYSPNVGFIITDAASIWHIMTRAHDGGVFGAFVQIGCYFMIYHDDKNIYLKYHWFERSLDATQGSHLNIDLTSFLIS